MGNTSEERLAIFRDDARWPNTTLVESDAEAIAASEAGKEIWSCFYGSEQDEGVDEDDNPLFTTVGDDEIRDGTPAGEESGLGPYRIVNG